MTVDIKWRLFRFWKIQCKTKDWRMYRVSLHKYNGVLSFFAAGLGNGMSGQVCVTNRMSHQLTQFGYRKWGKKNKTHTTFQSGFSLAWRGFTDHRQLHGAGEKWRRLAHATNSPPDDRPASSDICWAESSLWPSSVYINSWLFFFLLQKSSFLFDRIIYVGFMNNS